MGVQTNHLGTNLTNIMESLSENTGIVQLLKDVSDSPHKYNVLSKDKQDIKRISSPDCRIFPYPFDPNAQETDKVFVRAYYAVGEFDNSGVIMETDLQIDIICAKSLWLIKDIKNKPTIRPYEIMSRIIDTIGIRSGNGIITIDVKMFRHLAVNNEFDAIRLYCNYSSPIEDNPENYGRR